MNRYIPALIATALTLSGCATNTREVATVEKEAAPDREIEIGFGARRRSDYGLLVVMEYNSNGWAVANMVDSRKIGYNRTIRAREGQEVLFISSDLKYAEPFFEDQTQIQQETVVCNVMFSNNPLYNPCSSRFMTVNAFKSLGKSAWSILTDFGMSSGTHKALDHDTVAEAIAATDLLTSIEKQVAAWEYQEYRDAFNEAKTAIDFSAFIDKYARHDPDGLIAQAIARRNVLLYQEELDRQGIDPVTLKQREAQASADELATFRDNLQAGINTNCGPILHAEGGWVRIQKVVDGFGDVHWIPQDKVFPPGFDCNFKNGEYVAPQ